MYILCSHFQHNHCQFHVPSGDMKLTMVLLKVRDQNDCCCCGSLTSNMLYTISPLLIWAPLTCENISQKGRLLGHIKLRLISHVLSALFLGSMIIHGLTHYGWVTHLYISKISIISSDNGLLPGRRQAIIWTDAGILLIQTSVKSQAKFIHFHSRKCIWKYLLENVGHFVLASMC